MGVMTTRALFLSCILAGCAGAPHGRTTPEGGILLRCRPPDAAVYVDEVYRGSCRLFAARPFLLTSGRHRLLVEATGHFPHYAEIEIRRVVTNLEVELVEEPD